MQSKQPLDPVSQSKQLQKLTGVVRFGLIGRCVETRNSLWEKKEFCVELEKLTVSEISFWLSRFILEIDLQVDPFPTVDLPAL